MRPAAWICAMVVVAALVGCGSTPTLSSGGPPRCDRTGDEDQRRAC